LLVSIFVANMGTAILIFEQHKKTKNNSNATSSTCKQHKVKWRPANFVQILDLIYVFGEVSFYVILKILN